MSNNRPVGWLKPGVPTPVWVAGSARAPAPQPAAAQVKVVAGFQVLAGGDPLRTGERGLLIHHPVYVNTEENSIIIPPSHNPDELRAAALYWDRIEVPNNGMLNLGLGADMDFLAAEGIVQRSRVQPTPGRTVKGHECLVQATASVFQTLESRDRGQWAMSLGANSIQVLGDKAIDGAGAMVSLYNALPVPDRDVPFEELLKFKSKRRSELLALRAELDAIYARIQSAPDRPAAAGAELEALDKAATEALRVALETKLPFRLADWKAKLNLSRGVMVAAPIFAGGQLVLPTFASIALTAVVGVAGVLEVTRDIAWIGKRDPGPFEYLIQLHKQVIGR